MWETIFYNHRYWIKTIIEKLRNIQQSRITCFGCMPLWKISQLHGNHSRKKRPWKTLQNYCLPANAIQYKCIFVENHLISLKISLLNISFFFYLLYRCLRHFLMIWKRSIKNDIKEYQQRFKDFLEKRCLERVTQSDSI